MIGGAHKKKHSSGHDFLVLPVFTAFWVKYGGSTRYFAVELELTFMGHISGSTALRVVPFQLRSQWGAEMRLILSLTNAAINCA